jgi:uncharacterized protein YheU (UPF0270 family)
MSESESESESEYVKIPPDALQAATLESLVEEFITREGTDYGEREHTLDEKKASVMRLLAAGEVDILFDPESETTTLARRMPESRARR